MQTCDWTAVLQNISLAIASLVAIFGIDAWRREYVGKRRMELAEEVLALFYQAQDAIRAIRSPFGFEGEGSTRKQGPDESPEEKEALERAYVVVERYNKHLDLFSRIHTLRYRFMAQIGSVESKPFDELNEVVKDIFLAARRLGRYWRREERVFGTEEQRKAHYAKVRDAERIFWEGEESDLVYQRVEALIRDIERTCQNILSSKGTLFGFINLPLWRRRRG